MSKFQGAGCTVCVLATFVFALPLAAFAQSATADSTGVFAKYSVPKIFNGRAAPLDLSSAEARMYRTRLRDATNRGTAFAGHYAAATWGCGAFCLVFAIVDLQTGKTSFFPATIQHSANGTDPLVGEAVDCRPDSRAVHIIGALNEQNNAADRWYVWNGSRFNLIQTRPARQAPDPQ